MNKKVMIIGAGAALLLGSVAIAQTTSSGASNSGSYQPAPSATDNSANTSATTSDNSANTSSTNTGADNASTSGANASATAGERG